MIGVGHGRRTHLGPPRVSGRPAAQQLPVAGRKGVDGLRSPVSFRVGFTQAISAAARHHPTEELPVPQWPSVPTPFTPGQHGDSISGPGHRLGGVEDARQGQ